MGKIKLLALDMDGTLLDSRKRISPRVKEALEALDARGVFVAAGTGRGLAEMDGVRRELPFMRFGFLDSGAHICDFAASRTIEMRPMSQAHVMACLDRCREEGAMAHFLTERESVVRSDQIGHLAEFSHADHQAAFEKICLRVGDMEDYALDHSGEILKVCMYHRDPCSRVRSLRALENTGMDLKFSGRTSLEAVAPGVDKGWGLRRLAAYLGFGVENCAAVGDGENDLAMLRTAGWSAAMGNAPESVRAEADMVAADCDHDGVADAVERVLEMQ